MPNINLIQEKRALSHRAEVRARTGFLTFVAIVVVSGLSFLMLLTKSGALQSEEADLNAQLQKLQPSVSIIENNQKRMRELEPRLTSLQEAQGLTQKWVRILTHFENQMPKDTWLTQIRSVGSDPEKPIAITLNGLSMSQDPISEFILRTQNEPDLSSIALGFTNERVGAYGQTIEFEIGGELAGSAPDKTKGADKS
ncbi:hypothetical protein BH11ARM1_BH11ARM1_08840 [soil metagenome]